MAGLYLIGFAAPAFEAAACHVGETKDPNRNVPRAMLAAAVMAGVYFIVLPVVWLGVLGPEPLGRDLATVLGPTFAPLLGSFGKAAAIWFIMLNMFHGTMQPLAGAARTMSQLSRRRACCPASCRCDDKPTDCPWAATAADRRAAAIVFLLAGDPVWMIAAANFTYLIGICMPNIAAWLLRRDMPDAPAPYRAPRGTIMLGVIAACDLAAVAPFSASSSSACRRSCSASPWPIPAPRSTPGASSRTGARAGLPAIAQTLHVKLTGAMVLVLVLDGDRAICMAVNTVSARHHGLVAVLEDIFVPVALLTISVGLVLPGMITYSATEVSEAAKRLTSGTLREFSQAMAALGRGDLDAAHASVNIVPVKPNSRDELGEMAESFNVLQEEVRKAGARSRRGAREDADGARRADCPARGDRLSRPSRPVDRSAEPAGARALRWIAFSIRRVRGGDGFAC